MTYHHSSVYIVRVVDTDDHGETATWFVGPYGTTRASQVAAHLESVIRSSRDRDAAERRNRECWVEPLWSDEECLTVGDYGR